MMNKCQQIIDVSTGIDRTCDKMATHRWVSDKDPVCNECREAMIVDGDASVRDFESIVTLQAALVFVERTDGGVLSVFNRKHGVWGLPGGKVEPGETVRQAAIRELAEETGHYVMEHYLHGPVDIQPTYAGDGCVCHTFTLNVDPLDQHTAAASRELGGGVGWMTREFLMSQSGSPFADEVAAWFKRFFVKVGPL